MFAKCIDISPIFKKNLMFVWLLETLKYWQISSVSRGCRGNIGIGRKKWYVGRKVPADQWCYSVLKLDYQTLISWWSSYSSFLKICPFRLWWNFLRMLVLSVPECGGKRPEATSASLHCCLRHANMTAGSHQRSWRDMNYTGMEVKMDFRWILKTTIWVNVGGCCSPFGIS